MITVTDIQNAAIANLLEKESELAQAKANLKQARDSRDQAVRSTVFEMKVSQTEVAKVLGISRARVNQITYLP